MFAGVFFLARFGPGASKAVVGLRILHAVRSDAFAGVERYITYVAPELVRRGHEVTVVGGEPDRMRPLLEPAGIHHVVATTTPQVARSLAQAPRPDVVHTHMTAAEVAAVLTLALVRRPVVTTLHFAGARGTSGVRALGFRGLRPLFAREIAISEFVARAAGGRPLVIPNGVPDVGGGDSLVTAERDPTVLVAQRFEAEKDTATAVRAWARSGLADRGWTLDLAGGGALRGELERLVHELGVSGSVRFLGKVDDLAARMRRAGVFVATAPAEPFGLSVAEAMAAGLPIIAADGGGHHELLGPVGDGQLVAAHDRAAFAARLVAMADDPAQRGRLGRANRARYHAEYTLERHVDRLEAVYQGLATRPVDARR